MGTLASNLLVYLTCQSHLNIYVFVSLMQEAHLKFPARCVRCPSPCNPTRCDHKISENESHIYWPLGKKSIKLFFNSSRYRVKKCFNALRVKGTQVKIHLFFHFMHLFPVPYNLCIAAVMGTAGGRTQLSHCLEDLPCILWVCSL